MTDRSTSIAEKKQSDRLREKLSTPEGRMQDSLERTLPQSVVTDAQKREMWAVHPDVAASSAVFDAVLLLVQARYLAIRDSAGAKSFGRWFQSSKAEAQELDAWCRKLVGKAAKSFNFADKFRAEAQSGIESEAEELYLRFVRSSRQCVFRIKQRKDELEKSAVSASEPEPKPDNTEAVRQAATALPPKPNRYADEGNGRRLKNCPCELDGRQYTSLDTMAVILDITDGEAYRQVMERGKFLKGRVK